MQFQLPILWHDNLVFDQVQGKNLIILDKALNYCGTKFSYIFMADISIQSLI